MAAQLMAATSNRLQFNQGVSTARIAIDRYRQLDFRQFPEVR